MITPHNIANYIDYLHQKKYGVPAAPDLKSKWAQVPPAEIKNQLHMLYQHWQMSVADGAAMEQEFLAQQSPIPNPTTYIPTPPPAYQAPANIPPVNNYPAVQPKSNNTLWILLAVVAILGLAGYIVYDKMTHKAPTNNDASVLTPSTLTNQDNTTPAATATVTATKVDTPTTAAATTTTKEDEQIAIENEKTARSATIKQLISAEERRDLNGILNTFASNMTEYWDLKNPSAEQLKNRYQHTWTITDENKISNPSIKRISKNVYDLYGEYKFYSLKDDQYKTVPVHTRFVFDDNGKIIKTYGVK